MGPMERKERERQELRRKILDTARRLFAEEGYEAVTMRTIAHEIEYSPRTIYLHFKDKEDLIRQLCEEDFRSLGEGLGQLMGIQDPLERLQAAGRAYAAFAEAFPHHYQLMFMAPPRVSGSFGAAATQVQPKGEAEGRCGASGVGVGERDWKGQPEADAYAFLVTCLREALQKGLLRPEWNDPDLAAQVVWGALHGVIALHVTHRDDPCVPWLPLDRRIESMIRLIQWGLRNEAPLPPA